MQHCNETNSPADSFGNAGMETLLHCCSYFTGIQNILIIGEAATNEIFLPQYSVSHSLSSIFTHNDSLETFSLNCNLHPHLFYQMNNYNL